MSREDANRRARAWYHANKSRLKKYHKSYRLKKQAEVLRAYGNKCSCCGESNPAFLTLDHVAGGGQRERRELGGGVMSIYHKAIRDGFPSCYQILCFNCNCARAFRGDGICPHRREQLVTSVSLILSEILQPSKKETRRFEPFTFIA